MWGEVNAAEGGDRYFPRLSAMVAGFVFIAEMVGLQLVHCKPVARLCSHFCNQPLRTHTVTLADDDSPSIPRHGSLDVHSHS